MVSHGVVYEDFAGIGWQDLVKGSSPSRWQLDPRKSGLSGTLLLRSDENVYQPRNVDTQKTNSSDSRCPIKCGLAPPVTARERT